MSIMALVEPHSVIESFVAAYQERREFFRKVAELCHDQCRTALIGEAIRHFASYRAKSSERLKEKLYQRLEERHKEGKDYPDTTSIEDDIADFAGVRIALYFPGDALAAVKVLSKTFDVEQPRPFKPRTDRPGPRGYVYRFGGYSATHLRARLRRDTVKNLEDAAAYAKARIEIQVASVFMHAWAEVEHDLVYKPLEGTLSLDEYSLLDQVNGLAYAAEVALEQLQRTRARGTNRQEAFPNHYDLASYIHAHTTEVTAADTPMGRADRLFTFLTRLDLNHPDKVDSFIKKIANTWNGAPLVDRLVEIVVESEPADRDNRRRMWNEIVVASMATNPYIGYTSAPPHDEARVFMSHWTTFYDTSRRIVSKLTIGRRSQSWPDKAMIEETLGFDHDTTTSLLAARDAYSRLITGTWRGSDNELEHHSAALEKGLWSLHARFPHVAPNKEENL
jgi:ppGpp synthetase/RelA/SpoT-type nucleotidyltranferase